MREGLERGEEKEGESGKIRVFEMNQGEVLKYYRETEISRYLLL